MLILSSLCLIVVGLVALLAPLWSSIGTTAIVSVIIIAGGVIHILHSLNERRGSVLAWHLAIGVLYVLAGLYMLVHPLAGLATLSILIAALLFVEGVLRLVAYSRLRREGGAGWLLFDGIVTLLLSGFIVATWPYSALWVPGTVVGISLIVGGVSRLLHVRIDRGMYGRLTG